MRTGNAEQASPAENARVPAEQRKAATDTTPDLSLWLEPVSRRFGFDRGQCIDRYYIERFLESNREDDRGRVLEVAENTYTRRFGGDRVVQSDILHAEAGHRSATIVADLTKANHVPSDAFDCIILTLRLEINGEVREWDLGEAAAYLPADLERHRAWSVLQADAPTPRQALYRSLHQALRALPTPSRQAATESLRVWVGATRVVRTTHERLNPVEIVHLADASIEVGAHTLTHPVLSTLPPLQ